MRQASPAAEEPKRAELPLDLKLAGMLLVFCGTAAVLRMAVALLSGELWVGLSLFALPAGLGVLRLRRGWRTAIIAVYTVFLALTAFGLLVLLVIFLVNGLELPGDVSLEFDSGTVVPLPVWVTVGLTGVWLTAQLFPFVVLRRRGVRRLFEDAPEKGQRLTAALRRGVIASVFLATILTAAGFCLLRSYKPTDYQEAWGDADRMCYVAWGYRGDRLTYVVFKTVDRQPGEDYVSLTPPVTTVSDGEAVLHRPGRPGLRLPGAHFLYACFDGKWESSDLSLTDEELDAIREARLEFHSLQDLIDFAQEKREAGPDPQ